MLKKIVGLSSLFFMIASSNLLAQGQGNSPYSVIGVGEVTDPTSVSQDGMGGTGVSFGNGFYINTLNAALLPKNRVAGPYKYVALNVGLKGRLNSMQTTTSQQRDFGMNLNNLGMAFPIKPYLATAVVLQPYSLVDHRGIRQQLVQGSTTESVQYEMQSRGGVSRVAWMNGLRIKKSFYVGMEASYLFGTIVHDTTSVLSSVSSTYLRNSARENMRGYQLKPSFAVQQKLTDKWQLNVGGTYEMATSLKGTRLRTFSSLVEGGNGPQLSQVPDTVSNADITTKLPSAYRLGFSFESPFKWVFSAEYGRRNWSEVKHPLLTNSQEIAVGLEYVPNANSTKYLNQVFYRLGYKQVQSPYVFNGTRINDRSFHTGLSLPLGFRNPSYVDLSLAVGRRGVTSNSLVQENYLKMGVNFSLLNTWFIKPVID